MLFYFYRYKSLEELTLYSLMLYHLLEDDYYGQLIEVFNSNVITLNETKAAYKINLKMLYLISPHHKKKGSDSC